jgi:hypothetical protein
MESLGDLHANYGKRSLVGVGGISDARIGPDLVSLNSDRIHFHGSLLVQVLGLLSN